MLLLEGIYGALKGNILLFLYFQKHKTLVPNAAHSEEPFSSERLWKNVGKGFVRLVYSVRIICTVCQEREREIPGMADYF